MANMLLKNVRLSYFNGFKPVSFNGGPEKYSTAILIDEDDPQVAELEALVKRVAEEQKDKFPGGKVPRNYRSPLRSGEEKEGEEYRGMVFLNAKANADRPPVIVGPDKQEVIDPSEVYSGCYAHVNIGLYAYSVSGNSGVGVGLNGVMKTRDGDRLGGGSQSVDSMFGDSDDFLK